MGTIPPGIKKTAVLCVLKNGRHFLLLKRLKPPNQNMFTPVGGKLDPFEDPSTAAYRETREETGIYVEAFRYCGVLVESAPNDYNWSSFVYLAEIDLIAPPPCPEGELHWIAFDEVLDVPTPTTDWFIYKYLLEGRPFMLNAIYDDKGALTSMREEIANEEVFPGK